MIKEPLTKKQKKELLKNFTETFEREYQRLLRDTCIDPESDHVAKGTFVIGKIALNRAAQQYIPFQKDLQDLCNL